MEIIKRKENHKNPVNTAKRNCYALGGFNVIIGILFLKSQMTASIAVIVMGMLLLIAGYLLSRRKVAGLYLSWAYIIVGTIVIIYNSAFLALIIMAYFAYWTYKAQKEYCDYKAQKSGNGSAVDSRQSTDNRHGNIKNEANQNNDNDGNNPNNDTQSNA